MIVHLALVLTMLAPPSEEAAIAAFNAGDHARALEMYRERAAAPGVHPPDALAGAHDCLRALHRREPTNAAHICEALDLARAVLARDDLTADERAFWLELEAKDVTLADGACPSPAPPEPSSDNEPASAESTPSGPTPSDGKPTPAESTPPAAEVGPQRLAAAPTSNALPRRSVPRLAIGGTLSGLAVVLAGGMAASLVGRRSAGEELDAINATYTAEGRPPTDEELAAGIAANDRGRRLGGAALALGLASGASLVAGLAVLLARPRASSRARLRAAGAGLVYSF